MKTLYFVLGMHRSGTSLTTQLLSHMNVWLGREEWLLPKASDNENGFGELQDLVDMDELLLTQSKYHWFSLKKPSIDYEAAKDMINNFAEKYLNNNKEAIAIKDPRLTILWRQWLEVLHMPDRTIRGIIVVRNPFEVADSLYKRNNMDKAYALCLWYRYNWECLLFSLEYDNLWTNYSDYFTDFSGQAERVWKFVHEASLHGDDKFAPEAYSYLVSNKLRHHRHDANPLSSVISIKAYALYNSLVQLCNGQKNVQEIIDSFSEDYKEVYRLCNDTHNVEKEALYAKCEFLSKIYSIAENHWEEPIKNWVEHHPENIFFCGNGRNLEKILPIFEKYSAGTILIFDKSNFSARKYKNKVIQILPYERLPENNTVGSTYIVTPFYDNETEIHEMLSDKVCKDNVYLLSNILMNEHKKGILNFEI